MIIIFFLSEFRNWYFIGLIYARPNKFHRIFPLKSIFFVVIRPTGSSSIHSPILRDNNQISLAKLNGIVRFVRKSGKELIIKKS